MKVKYIKYLEDPWLITGKEYIVDGLSADDGCVSYFLYIDGVIGWYPFDDFEIIDSRLSRFWVLSVKGTGQKIASSNLSVSFVKNFVTYIKSFFWKITPSSSETRQTACTWLSIKEFANDDIF